MSGEDSELQEETLEDFPPQPIAEPSEPPPPPPVAPPAPAPAPKEADDVVDVDDEDSKPKSEEVVTTPEGLQEFGVDIWTVEGPVINFLGYPFPTRMAVVKLSDGTSWLWSPIPFSETLGAEIEEKVGPIRHLVSPNKLHHLFLKQWVTKYPDAKVYVPPGLKERNLETMQGIDLDENNMLTDTPDPSYSSDIDQLIFAGSFFMEEVLFYHRSSSTIIIGDLIQRHAESDIGTGWKARLMKLDGIVGPDGGTPREWRLSFIFGKEKARVALTKITETWCPERMVISHGQCAEENATALIKLALKWLG